MGTRIRQPLVGGHVEFQAILRLVPTEPQPGDALEQVASLCTDALIKAGPMLALGAVAAVNLDEGTIELEMTIEASSDAEFHQKMARVLEALEAGTPLRMVGSSASRAPDSELICA